MRLFPVIVLLTAACHGEIGAPIASPRAGPQNAPGARSESPHDAPLPEGGGPPNSVAALDACTPPEGRPTYTGLAGEDLGAELLEIDPRYERRRPLDLKTYNDNKAFTLLLDLVWIAGKPTLYIDGAGLRPYESCSVGQAFGFSCSLFERAELQWSAIGVHVLYELAWRTCRATLRRPGENADPEWLGLGAVAATPENARVFCGKQARWSWGRTPDEEELAACVAVALEVRAVLPPDAPPLETWAHVCASVVASVPSITY